MLEKFKNSKEFNKGLIKISKLSKATGVPVKTIRYYTEIGLLLPSKVDSESGYRFFDEKSINRLNEIMYFKKLGFSLKEIKIITEQTINKKINEMQKKIHILHGAVEELSIIQCKGNEIISKNFTNDIQLLGKWKFEYFVKSVGGEEVNLSGKWGVDELTFIPNGQGYWVIECWTKGYIFFRFGFEKPQPFAYKIKDGKLYIDFSRMQEENFFAVYSNINHEEYQKKQLICYDKINQKPFAPDNRIIGSWQCIDYVKNKDDFRADKKFWKGILLFKEIHLISDGSLILIYQNGRIIKLENSWTKGEIYSNFGKELLIRERYFVKETGGKKYLLLEYINGDVIYRNAKPGYYVFEKIE